MFSLKTTFLSLLFAGLICPLAAMAAEDPMPSGGLAPAQTAAVPVPTVPTAGAPDGLKQEVGLARPPLHARTNESAQEIADINERLAVLSARLAELELQAKIAEKISEISKISKKGDDTNLPEGSVASVPPSGPSPTNQNAAPPPAPSVYKPYIPSIKGIEGADGTLHAALYTATGDVSTVGVGDKIDRWTVKKITVDSVTIESGSETIKLGFGTFTPRLAGTPKEQSRRSMTPPPINPSGLVVPQDMTTN